jgi:pyruvate kinase
MSVWSERVNEKRPANTKIVATIGPASEQAEPLQAIVSAGMRVMR